MSKKDLNQSKSPEKPQGFFKETMPSLIAALLLAIFVRSLFFEPFHIPSSSMKPNLLIGDYIFVKKYSYGYTKYSFPFSSFNLFNGRFFDKNKPQQGDVAVFRLPKNPKINYIKRIIGKPGDKIQVIKSRLYINGQKIDQEIVGTYFDQDNKTNLQLIQETLPSKTTHKILNQHDNYIKDYTDIYFVPKDHYFVMGDNRDNSQDSRFLNEVGFIHQDYLIGKASIVFFSINDSIFKFWKLHKSIRFNRIFDSIK